MLKAYPGVGKKMPLPIRTLVRKQKTRVAEATKIPETSENRFITEGKPGDFGKRRNRGKIHCQSSRRGVFLRFDTSGANLSSSWNFFVIHLITSEYNQKLPPILTRKDKPSHKGTRLLEGSAKRVIRIKQITKRMSMITIFRIVAASMNQTVFVFLDIG
jgi:hypothetical protein